MSDLPTSSKSSASSSSLRRRLRGKERGIEAAIANLSERRKTALNITDTRRIEARDALFGEWPQSVHPDLLKALHEHGITRPWSHQAEAVRLVEDGKNLVVVTPTASGKTLCYNVPVVNCMLREPGARALYLFPTKALSRDQMAELNELTARLEVKIGVHTYDGDTPSEERRLIRRTGRVIVTNPDMLHQAILPHHTRWAQIFENLRYIVIDELHTYRGVFGSHMANLIRRLKRIAAFYRSDPIFIMASATIANPRELAETLIEDKVEEILGDGSPSGEKTFVCYNPPIVNHEYGIRANALKQARNLALDLMERGVRTIVFVKSRLSVEVLTAYLREAVEKRAGDAGRVRGYRGGYLPKTRREIERGLRDGKVDCVISTNALELGIDIGGLDASILCGYPGSIASTWQQAGRSGRRQGKSLTILVGQSNALDQFLVNQPEYFYGRSPEQARINPDNLLILLAHVKCAAFELPFCDDEEFGDIELKEMLEYLAEQGVVHYSEKRWHWMADDYPADHISLRSVVAENFLVVRDQEKSKIIAEVDFTNAPKTIYEGAIYMVEGQKYKVTKLDWDERRAYVEDAEDDYYTDALSYTRVTVLDVFEERSNGSLRLEHGEVKVLEHVSGFKKIKFHTSENVGFGDVVLPDNEMHTTAFWFTLPGELQLETGLTRSRFLDGLSGIGTVLKQLGTLFLMCDSGDIGRSIGDKSARWFLKQRQGDEEYHAETEDVSRIPVNELDSFDPTLFIYDAYPGGIGFSELLYNGCEMLLQKSRELISNCECTDGCPSCIGPADGFTSEGAREATLLLLDCLLQSKGLEKQ